MHRFKNVDLKLIDQFKSLLVNGSGETIYDPEHVGLALFGVIIVIYSVIVCNPC